MDKTIDSKRSHLSLTRLTDPCLNTILRIFYIINTVRENVDPLCISKILLRNLTYYFSKVPYLLISLLI